MKSEPLQPTRTSFSDESDELQVSQAMEVYLRELEAGKHPAHGEFLARYPAIAPELEGLIEGIDFLHGIAPQADDQKTLPMYSADKAIISTRATLGDFRLIRQIGQGGMGVVYEAEQLSLGRRVAVKVLPFAAMLNDQHQKRFYNEARAAASLDHPNIVPIHFVGQERGVHFYAMQLINGQSLADLIAALVSSRTNQAISLHHSPLSGSNAAAAGEDPHTKRFRGGRDNLADTRPNFLSSISTMHSDDPETFFRTAARLGAEAAEAIQHAHELGILHRDIKPGNLLVDGSGKLWVADFGLATIEHGETLTRTGGIVGTAAYMSPEQAAASPNIDGRSDVYGLGATLYELLTMRRHRGDPIIGQQPPPRADPDVISLPHLKPAIPIDLETVIVKALAVEPADRYQTAGAMAADLRSFIAGTEIRARRLTFTQRQIRKLRRYQRLAAGAIVVSFVFVMSIAAAAFVYSSRLSAALREKDQALFVANESRERARLSESVALQNERQARESERNARENELFARRLSYRNDMRSVFQLFAEKKYFESAKLLSRQVPDAGQTDLRDVAWKVMNTEVNAKYCSLGSHDGRATECVLFPDGNTVATAGEDGLVHLWDVAGRQRIKTINPKIGGINALAISPDGRTLAVGGRPSLITHDFSLLYLVDVQSGRRLRSVQRHVTTIETVEFSPNGQLIAAGSRWEQVKISTIDGTQLHSFDASHGGNPVAFSPDSKFLAACCEKQEFQIWDCVTGEPRFEQPIDTSWAIGSIRWGAQGDYLAISSSERPFLHLYDANAQSHEGSHLGELTVQHWPAMAIGDVYIAADASIVAGDTHGVVHKWKIKTENLRARHASPGSPYQERENGSRTFVGGENITSIVATSNGSIVTTHSDGSVNLLSPNVSAVKVDKLSFDVVAATQLSDDELVVGSRDGSIRRVEIGTLSAKEIVTASEMPIADLAVTDDGSLIAAGFLKGRIDLVETESGTVRHRYLGSADRTDTTVRVAISRTGRYVARTGADLLLTVWEKDQDTPVFIHRDSGIGYAAEFSPDESLIAVAMDGVKVFQTASGQLHNEFGLTRIHHCGFSPDGKSIAAGHLDGRVRIHNLSSGKDSVSPSHATMVNCVTFDSTGRVVVSSDVAWIAASIVFSDVETGEVFGKLVNPLQTEQPSGNSACKVFVTDRHLVLLNVDFAETRIAVWDFESLR